MNIFLSLRIKSNVITWTWGQLKCLFSFQIQWLLNGRILIHLKALFLSQDGEWELSRLFELGFGILQWLKSWLKDMWVILLALEGTDGACGGLWIAAKEFPEDFRPLSKEIFVWEKVEETRNLNYISFELSGFVFGWIFSL